MSRICNSWEPSTTRFNPVRAGKPSFTVRLSFELQNDEGTVHQDMSKIARDVAFSRKDIPKRLVYDRARVIVDIFFDTNAVAPLPLTDTAQTAIRGRAVSVVMDVISQDVISSIGQMLVLDDEIELDRVIPAPRLAQVSWEAGAAHRQGVVKDDQLVASPPLAGMYQASKGVPSSDGI